MLFRQRVISAKNVSMATEWARSDDQEVAQLSRIVADIGRVHPARKRRLPFLRNRHADLWARMVAAGAVYEIVVEHEAEIEQYERDAPYSSSDDGIERNVATATQANDYDDGDEIPF